MFALDFVTTFNNRTKLNNFGELTCGVSSECHNCRKMETASTTCKTINDMKHTDK